MKPVRLAMHLPPGWQQRWPTGVAAFALGLCGVLWLSAPQMQMLQTLDEETTRLQAQLQKGHDDTVSQAQTPQHAHPSSDAPALNEAVSLWPWLQQRLQAHGLEVLSLKPQAMVLPGGLPEQTAQLRLQGRWSDWMAFERAMNRHVPWWITERWQVTTAGGGSAQVRIEWQVRMGLQPAKLSRRQAQAQAQGWPQWVVAPDLGKEGRTLFDSPSSAPQAARMAASAPLAGNPRQWPVRALHLLGVWQQQGVSHAVLGQGMNAVVVRPGQRVGQEGYRVRTVSQAGVRLQSADGGDDLLLLPFQGDKP